MGGKQRAAKYIAPILARHLRPDQCFVDVFAGAFTLTSAMAPHASRRIANDLHPYLIALYRAVQAGYDPPATVSREMHSDVRQHKDRYPPELVGFVGFGCSFGGTWFGGYAFDSVGTDYAAVARRTLLRQRDSLQGVEIHNCDYRELAFPPRSLLYCDPPYANATPYTRGGGLPAFDTDTFWAWAQQRANAGHTVFVSEYDAPKVAQLTVINAECVWEREQTTTLCRNKDRYKTVTERLFRLSPAAMKEMASDAAAARISQGAFVPGHIPLLRDEKRHREANR